MSCRVIRLQQLRHIRQINHYLGAGVRGIKQIIELNPDFVLAARRKLRPWHARKLHLPVFILKIAHFHHTVGVGLKSRYPFNLYPVEIGVHRVDVIIVAHPALELLIAVAIYLIERKSQLRSRLD